MDPSDGRILIGGGRVCNVIFEITNEVYTLHFRTGCQHFSWRDLE